MAQKYRCSACEASAGKWSGKCGNCGSWNTLEECEEEAAPPEAKNRLAGLARSSPPQKLCNVKAEDVRRLASGVSEFDRAFGGGLVEGGVALVGGDPGVGKSTLLLQVIHGLSREMHALYVTGEESIGQIALRSQRLGLDGRDLTVMAEISLEATLAEMDRLDAKVVVIDSLNTMMSEAVAGAPGSPSQMKVVTTRLTRHAKARGTAMVLVIHMTKDDSISGPKAIEHLTDACATMGGESHSRFRILRTSKNRFGALDLGVFACSDAGMLSVTNPSAMFLACHSRPVSGTCVMAAMEGARPLLVEVQALLEQEEGSSRRLSLGFDRDRLSMLLAVMGRHGGAMVAGKDVYVNAVGGVDVKEPGADLAVMLALLSSFKNKALRAGTLAFGEVGLAGEVRPVAYGQERLREAAKLGFANAIVPRANCPKSEIEGLTVVPVDRIDDAMERAAELWA